MKQEEFFVRLQEVLTKLARRFLKADGLVYYGFSINLSGNEATKISIDKILEFAYNISIL